MNKRLEKISDVNWFLYDPKAKMVCLHRRDHKAPTSANMWDVFGGAIEDGESVKKAFARELREELGIRIKADQIKMAKGRNMHCVYFSMQSINKLKLGEGAGFAFFPVDDVFKLKDLTRDARRALRGFINDISNKNK